MAQRNTPQYQIAEQAQPYMGEYSRLAEQFLKKRNTPVYSIGQGLAEAGGDIAEAYLLKKAAEKDAAKEGKDFSDFAMAQKLAMDSGLAKDPRSGAVYSQADFNGLQTQGINPMGTQDRYAAAVSALAGVNPRMAVAGAPNLMESAKFAEPQKPTYQNVPGVGLAEIPPNGGKPSLVLAAKQEQSPLARMIAERDALPDGDPRRATYDAAIKQQTTREPGNVQTETFDDGVYVINPNGTRGPKLGDAPARERVPRVKTYYDESGNPMTLDSNDAADQAKIKSMGLVESAPTEGERNAKGFLDRMTAAETEINKILEKNPNAVSGVYDAVVNKIPIIGNKMVSEDYQTALQKIKDWVRAKLRKESGAVIGDQEALDEYRTYFGIPGDNPQTLEGKRTSRVEARRQLATQAGILGRGALRDIQAEDAIQKQGKIKEGHVEDGYKFKGGDPSDPKNWVPLNG